MHGLALHKESSHLQQISDITVFITIWYEASVADSDICHYAPSNQKRHSFRLANLSIKIVISIEAAIPKLQQRQARLCIVITHNFLEGACLFSKSWRERGRKVIFPWTEVKNIWIGWKPRKEGRMKSVMKQPTFASLMLIH
jgi:hypothetical protein